MVIRLQHLPLLFFQPHLHQRREQFPHSLGINRIVSVCVGPTREKKIAGYFKDVYKDDIKNYHPFEMVAHKAPYSKSFNFKIEGEYIDDIYEGKAYDWLLKNIDYKKEKTMMWLVGKRPRADEIEKLILEKN